jgi:hypothetical protein
MQLPRPHLPRPHLHLHLHVPRPRLRMPSSPVPVVVAFVRRWRGGRATLSLESRRARTMLIGAIVVARGVLLSSFPLGSLLTQRSALSGTARELATVKAENAALSRQVSSLHDPATINDLARLDYGFVPKGQRAYDILPSSSPSGSALSASGLVPLDSPPVVPGSARSQALIGVTDQSGISSPSPATASARSAVAQIGSVSGEGVEPPEPHSYWGRVVRSLEFWN